MRVGPLTDSDSAKCGFPRFEMASGRPAGSLVAASVLLDYAEGNPYPADISARNLYEIERHQVREREGREVVGLFQSMFKG